MAKTTRGFAQLFEMRKERGKTVVVLDGLNGCGIDLYTGGPKDAMKFRNELSAILDSLATVRPEAIE